MATSTEDICNRALSLIGAENITSIDDSVKEAEKAKQFYAACAKEILRSHFWNCAQGRSRLVRHCGGTQKDISGATKADPCVVTCNGHGMVDGQRVKISDVVGMTELNGNTYTVSNPATNTFELRDAYDEEDINSTGYTDYVSGGKAAPEDTPTFGYSYHYDLPTDCVRVKELDDLSLKWEVEGDLLLADTSDVKLVYTKDLGATWDSYDPLCLRAVVVNLAARLAFVLTGDLKKQAELLEMLYRGVLPKAKAVDGQERSLQKIEVTGWEQARY